MPSRPQFFQFTSIVDVPESAANTETVAATLASVNAEFPGQQINLQAVLSILMAASTTAMTLRIRRASLTGTLIGEAETEAGDIAASKASTLQVFAQDSPGEAAGMIYVVTFQATAGGAAATCTAQSFTARVQ